MNMKMTSHRLYLQFRLAGWLLMLTLIAVNWVRSANAQATNAQMSGRVVDPTGAVIPNASIEIQNTGTGLDRTVTTSANGEYVIPSLPVGTDKLRAVAPGFKNYTRSGIILEAGQNVRLDATLQIGSATETIQVSESTVQVDTSSATIRTEVDSTQIKELPLNTRNTLQLMTLVPGVGNASSSGAATSSLPATVTNQRSGPLLSWNDSPGNGSV